MQILFVCTANQFRSPLSAALFQRELDQRPQQTACQAVSAGTWAVAGKPVPEITFTCAKSLNLTELESHRTQPVTAENLQQSDVVLVMEANQREAICSEFPSAARKVYLLSEICLGRSYDIPDPAKTSVSAREVAQELAMTIHTGFERILAKAHELSKPD